MQDRIDAKGKFFKTRVSKQTMAIVARVADSVIHGNMHLIPDNRLRDELNTGESFLAVTDARIYDTSGERLMYEADVLIIHKQQLIWIFPEESSLSDDHHANGNGR